MFILDILPTNKITPWPDAIDELARLEHIDIGKPKQISPSIIEIISLNIRSLPAHIDHIKADHELMSAQLILLQETWVPSTVNPTELFTLKYKQQHFNGGGRGKGIATYFTPEFVLLNQATEDKFQITSITSNVLIVTNVYRSTDANIHFLNTLTNFIQDCSKAHIVMGDMNFCQIKIKKLLENHHFHPAIVPPISRHMGGRCLDQIYIRLTLHVECKNVSVKTCYYSDHEPISITLEIKE